MKREYKGFNHLLLLFFFMYYMKTEPPYIYCTELQVQTSVTAVARIYWICTTGPMVDIATRQRTRTLLAGP